MHLGELTETNAPQVGLWKLAQTVYIDVFTDTDTIQLNVGGANLARLFDRQLNLQKFEPFEGVTRKTFKVKQNYQKIQNPFFKQLF